MNRFFTGPVVGVLSRMFGQGRASMSLGVKRIPMPRELPDHILKDIGISRSEILSLTRFGGHDRSRRQRA